MDGISLSFHLVIMMSILFVLTICSIRILKEYERAVIFRLRRFYQVKGPGWIIVLFPIERMVKVSLRVTCFEIPSQDVVTCDNVSVKVHAVVCYRVAKPRQAVLEVDDYHYSVKEVSTTILGTILPTKKIYELLYQKAAVNAELKDTISKHTDSWGIQVTAVEINDIEIPPEMRSTVTKLVEA